MNFQGQPQVPEGAGWGGGNIIGYQGQYYNIEDVDWENVNIYDIDWNQVDVSNINVDNIDLE